MAHINFSNRIALCLILFCISINISCKAQKQPMKMANDTIGIEITNKEFNSLIKESLNQLSDSTFEKDSSYCINFIRIVNTIEKNNLFAKYKDVRDVFYEKVYKEALVKLNASFYKGGAFYCQDYNLFIGGAPHYNSQYIIIDN